MRIGSSVYVLKDKGLNVCGVVGCKRGSSMVFIDKDNKGEKVVISLCSVHSVFDEIF